MDYSKLLGRITETCGTRGAFAAAMGIGADTLGLKLKGKSAFTADEIYKAVSVLNLNVSDIPAYFFAERVSKT
jgi:hypothetical protein